MNIPKVFLSYSHDTLEHKKWVNELGTRLRNNGIDAVLDQWELQPGDDLPHFMETHLSSSDWIIMICTERYVEKANKGKGGVGYEKMIITSNLLENIDENKIIPIIRQNNSCYVPTFLKTKLYLNLSKDSDFEYNFDELLRTIHQSPLLKKPQIGNNPFVANNTSLQENRLNDSILNFMKYVVLEYENSDLRNTSISARLIQSKMNISRIYFDFLVKEIVKRGLVIKNTYNRFFLTDKGKMYAINNDLVN